MTGRHSLPRYTYLELLIVVVVLGVLAAIVVPQVSTASPEDRRAALGRILLDVRSQVALYKAQHNGRFPTADGTAATTWDWSKLTGRTDAAGHAVATAEGAAFGPYLSDTPTNPVSYLAPERATAVAYQAQALTAGDTCDSAAGWAIDGTGHFWALTGTGRRVYDETAPGERDRD